MNKIDFAGIITVKNSNPNGDPLNGNRPRIDFSGIGEISDVCLKRKIRNRLQDMGECIFVQSDDRCDDGMSSLRNRAEEFNKQSHFMDKNMDKEQKAKLACEKWIDVRSFGQVFAYSSETKGDGVSIGIRGPVTIQSAFSIEPINITTIQITKSVSGEGDGKKSSDTMGKKHRVDDGIYVFFGSINSLLAQKTGFSDDDADKIKKALVSLFENDESSARPAGSMELQKLFWWKHNCEFGQYNSATVHRSLKVLPAKDGVAQYTLSELEGLSPEILEGSIL